MILQISPDSSAWVRNAAAVLLILHIGGGSVGLLSGSAALVLRKGGRWHRMAGHVFLVSMLTMSAIGASIAPLLGKKLDAIVGVFTFYLVATSWVTVRRGEWRTGSFERGAFLVASAAVAACLAFGLQAASSPTGLAGGYPPAAYGVLASMVAFAAALDLKMIVRGGLRGSERIARHLWRMCFALLIAMASFFLGQQQVFPASMRGSPMLLVPEIAIVGVLVFWLIRIRFTDGYRRDANG